jgi:ACT domain-containing protein
MRAQIEMELEDVPGQLVKVLEPISRFGGNIRNVLHERERKTPLGRVPVRVVFEVDEKVKLNRIVGALRRMGVRIIRIGEKEGALRSTVLLVGHVIDTDIRDTIERLDELRGVRILDLSLAMGAVGQESAARATITADDEARARAALSHLEKIAKGKKLLLVTSLEGM